MNGLDLAASLPDLGRDAAEMARTWVPQRWDSLDGPVIGAAYRCDYRAEEEFGVNNLRTALLGDDPRQVDPIVEGHTAAFCDTNAVALGVAPLPAPLRWLSTLGYGGHPHAEHFEDTLPRAQRFDHTLERCTVAQLRARAEAAGLPRPWPRRRAELMAALGAHLGAREPNRWPGWFHDGRHLVLRADTGVAAEVISRLAAAADANTLSVAPLHAPFSTGLFICDAADIGAATRADLIAQCDLFDAQMATVAEPVAALREAGFRIGFIGNPTEDACDGTGAALRFYLDVGAPAPAYTRVYGWYTAAEITVERLTADAAARRGERAAPR